MIHKTKSIFTLRIAIILLLLFLAPLHSPAISSDDKGSRGYWLSRHGEIRPEANPFSRRAHDVFRRVLKASDRRKGVDPEFIIINYSGRPWAQSIADGTIILTKNAVDFCYRGVDAETGDSRLAFVIGHELAHQFNGDFWHYLFFQAAEASGIEKSKAFNELRTIVKDSENFMVKEIQADQYGVIYASIAGYDMEHVISEDNNIFYEWEKAMDPSGFFQSSSSHPSPEQRSLAVTAKLKEVVSQLALFRTGVVAYYTGMYDESIAMMEEFARHYPSKEVYGNIGTAYLSVAYENYRLWKGVEAIPFKLSFGIDPLTSAESIEIGASEIVIKDTYFAKYSAAIDKADEYLRRASESGYDYALARNNLGCAYILEGRFHEAVAILDEASAFKPDDREILNNRGIANHYLAERLKVPQLEERAKADFKKALAVDGTFSAAFYNLALLEGTGGGRSEADVSTRVVINPEQVIKSDFGIGVGKPLPIGIKRAVKKEYFNKISVDGKVTLHIYDLPNVIVLERNGIVTIVISKKNIVSRMIVKFHEKGAHEKKFTYEDTEVWLYPSQGFGIEFRGNKIATEFEYAAGF